VGCPQACAWGYHISPAKAGLRAGDAGEQGSKGPKVRKLESCHGQPEGMSEIIHAEGCWDVDQVVISG
jgi:hypothetical protein